jgi:hypothetical protein
MGSVHGKVARTGGVPRRRGRGRGRGRDRGRGEGGFTLLELLMTLGVTTVGLVGLLSLHLSIVRANDAAGRAAEASQIGNAVLESLRAARTPDMMAMLTGSSTDTPPIDLQFCRRNNGTIEATTVGRNNMTFRCRVVVVPLTAASPNLWRLRVEVGWTEDGAARAAEGGSLDHLIAVEVIRTTQEAL